MNMDSYDCCKTENVKYQNTSSLSSVLKLVGDENRLKILCILQKGEHCVCEIIKHLNLSQTLVSHHLKDLKDFELVSDRKDSKWSYYSLTSKGKEITSLIFKINL